MSNIDNDSSYPDSIRVIKLYDLIIQNREIVENSGLIDRVLSFFEGNSQYLATSLSIAVDYISTITGVSIDSILYILMTESNIINVEKE